MLRLSGSEFSSKGWRSPDSQSDGTRLSRSLRLGGSLGKAGHIFLTALLVRVQRFSNLNKAVKGPSTLPIVLSIIVVSYWRRRRGLGWFSDNFNFCCIICLYFRISNFEIYPVYTSSSKYIFPDLNTNNAQFGIFTSFWRLFLCKSEHKMSSPSHTCKCLQKLIDKVLCIQRQQKCYKVTV